MAQKRIVILGAGLSGLSIAWHLKKNGIESLVFEKESEVGGLCRSKRVQDFIFDYDGHLLHFRHDYSFRFIKALLGNNLAEHRRNAWVYFRGRYSRYPFQANLYGLPPKIIKECLFNFIEAHRIDHPTDKNTLNFSDWIHKTFGRGIARHFMVPYNAKFWTVPLGELTCEWFDGFIPVPSVQQIIEGTIRDSHRQYGYNARFWYPREGGIHHVPLEMAKALKNIRTGYKAVEIDLKRKCVTFSKKECVEFDYLVSTIPLPEFHRVSIGIPGRIRGLFKKLRWSSIYNLNLGVEKKDSIDKHWIYFPGKETCFFRVGFPHNFSPGAASAGRSSLYAEVSYPGRTVIDQGSVTGRIKKDLKKTGIINNRDRICVQDVNDITYGYPIYDMSYRQAREGITGYLAGQNIFSCGRYGSWRYMSMEDVIIEGKETAEFLSKNV